MDPSADKYATVVHFHYLRTEPGRAESQVGMVLDPDHEIMKLAAGGTVGAVP